MDKVHDNFRTHPTLVYMGIWSWGKPPGPEINISKTWQAFWTKKNYTDPKKGYSALFDVSIYERAARPTCFNFTKRELKPTRIHSESFSTEITKNGNKSLSKPFLYQRLSIVLMLRMYYGCDHTCIWSDFYCFSLSCDLFQVPTNSTPPCINSENKRDNWTFVFDVKISDLHYLQQSPYCAYAATD